MQVVLKYARSSTTSQNMQKVHKYTKVYRDSFKWYALCRLIYRFLQNSVLWTNIKNVAINVFFHGKREDCKHGSGV